MAYVDFLHAERKARLARIAARAYVPPKPARVVNIEASPPRPPVKRRYGFYSPTKEDEIAWSIAMLDYAPRQGDATLLPYVRIEDIQREVCEHFGIEMVDLVSHRRTMPVMRYRQIAMHLCRRLTPRSFPEIGRRFNKRDHTTALWADRQIASMIETDEQMRASVEMIMHRLGGE